MVGEKKWGSGSRCPACDKTVYPNEQIFAADRKAWHKGCIHCAVRGCRNELFDRGMNKTVDGQNICDHCYEEMYDPRHYGPPPGMESLEERRLREAREAEERERKLREIEAMRGRKSSFGSCPQVYCMKITETVSVGQEISPTFLLSSFPITIAILPTTISEQH